MKLKWWISGATILIICALATSLVAPIYLIKKKNPNNENNNGNDSNGQTPPTNEAQVLVEKEVNSINKQNIALINPDITQDELDLIQPGNILDKLNIKLTYGDFDYTIDPQTFSKENGVIKFRITVSCYAGIDQCDYYELKTKEIMVPYNIVNQSGSIVDQVVNKLNALQLEWNLNKMVTNTFRFLSPKPFSNFYILNYFNNLDPQELDRKYNIKLNIVDGSFSIDILEYVVKFKIEVVDSNTSEKKQTIEKVLTYTPQANHMSPLDRGPTDPSIKIKNSYKGKLEILGKFEKNSMSNIEPEFNAMPISWKIKEGLYHLRFAFYQSFMDNASSIDYGIISYSNSRVELQLNAIIKNTTQFSPCIQDASMHIVPRQEFRSGQIISIKISYNPSDPWSLMTGGSIMPGFNSGYSFAQGENNEILQGMREDIYPANLYNWNIQITKDNQQIFNETPNMRSFPFLFPYIRNK